MSAQSMDTMKRLLLAPVFMLLLAGSMPAAAQTMYVTPRSGRLTDEIIAQDLVAIDSLGGVFTRAGTGARSMLGALRTPSLVALARKAYEGNDDGILTSQLLDAARSASTGNTGAGAGLAHTRRPDLWTLLDSAARASNAPERAADIAALESALLRAQHEVLGAPSCDVWEQEAIRIAARLRVPPPKPPVVVPPPPRDTAPTPKPEPPKVPQLATMVHFALDKSYLAPSSQQVLDDIVSAMNAYPVKITILLEGNTDQRASVQYNIALSRRRANSVRDYLVKHGIDKSRITIKALGKSQLQTTVPGIHEWAENRRVLLRYFGPDGKEIESLVQENDLQLEQPRSAKPRSRKR